MRDLSFERAVAELPPGFLLPDRHPVVEAAAGAVRAATGRTPAIRPWQLRTDGGHGRGTHGISTLGFAPGEERLAHTSRERLEPAQAPRAFGARPALVRGVQPAPARARGIPVRSVRPLRRPDPHALRPAGGRSIQPLEGER